MSKAFNPQDFYFRRAKEQGFRARSAFKLEELQKRFRLLKPGQNVVDVGCAPGSFLQYAATIVGPEGKLVGFDIKSVANLGRANIVTYVADVLQDDLISLIKKSFSIADIIVSDIAPNTSGIKDVDHGRSIQLNRAIIAIASTVLRNGGNVVLKVFDGREFPVFLKELETMYELVKVVKPEASRDRSREVYVVCMRKKNLETKS
ncbi:MAG: RlmE family RNA methyltransferase [Candidatus Abawacabacteria bacterium]|nr:RlmE family RNA methyltransferase [Candidatus Abawacabacteria bacterium]